MTYIACIITCSVSLLLPISPSQFLIVKRSGECAPLSALHGVPIVSEAWSAGTGAGAGVFAGGNAAAGDDVWADKLLGAARWRLWRVPGTRE